MTWTLKDSTDRFITVSFQAAASSFKGPVIVGLAAYHQKWPEHSEKEAMAKALEATLVLQKESPELRRVFLLVDKLGGREISTVEFFDPHR